VLVFAELLENATQFSPPESIVDVHAVPGDDGWCEISIVDRGIGMTARKMAEENRRLVERERLDIAPTSLLGLFVVGRLARRHGLSVVLEQTGSQGVTARVSIPPSLHVRGASPVPIESSGIPTSAPRKSLTSGAPDLIVIPVVPTAAGAFAWFDKPPTPPEPVVAPPKEQAEQRGSLNRRVRGAQLPEAALRPSEHQLPPEQPVPPGPVHDPMATRNAMDVFQAAFARAAAVAPEDVRPDRPISAPPAYGRASVPPEWPPPDWRVEDRREDRRIEEPRLDEPPAAVAEPVAVGLSAGGLTRRTPGASLAAEIREASRTGRPENAARQRDPEAERMAFEGYTAALAKAEEQSNPD
jgi:hypothetical protein